MSRYVFVGIIYRQLFLVWYQQITEDTWYGWMTVPEETQSKRDEKYVNLRRKSEVKFFLVNALYSFIKLLSPKLQFCRNRVQYSMSWMVSRIKGWSGMPSLNLPHQNRLCIVTKPAFFILNNYFDCLRGKVWLSGFGFSSPYRGFNLSIRFSAVFVLNRFRTHPVL